LARICIALIFASVIGIVIGVQGDRFSQIFVPYLKANAVIPEADYLLTTHLMLQVIVLEFVLLSFPLALLYLYAMMKGIMSVKGKTAT